MKHRKQRGRAAALGLAPLAMIVTATQAYATPIRFDNPPGEGHFMWAPGVGEEGIVLDFALPAEEQPGVVGGPTSIYQMVTATEGTSAMASPARLMTGVGSLEMYFLVGVDFGELIPAPDTSWNAGTSWHWYDGLLPPTGSLLPEGEPIYLGARFDLGNDDQYGWIGVVRGGDLLPSQLDPFAWGYETVAGVPIAAGVPEPGTLAALAVGAAALVGRRRRRHSQID